MPNNPAFSESFVSYDRESQQPVCNNNNNAQGNGKTLWKIEYKIIKE